MFATLLLVLIPLISQTKPPLDPTTLVDRLGSNQYAEREAASRALEELGITALPALQRGKSSRDPEIQMRCSVLLSRLDLASLTRPTLIRLDFQDVPVSDVTDEISRRSGMRLSLMPVNLPRWKTQKVKLDEKEQVPFWNAIDQLCLTAGLQYNPDAQVAAANREPGLTLTPSPERPSPPISDHGPFRISLESLHFQRDVNFSAPPALRLGEPLPRGRAFQPPVGPRKPIPPTTIVQFSAILKVAAEPRLNLAMNGGIEIDEARDDLGHSLVAATRSPSTAARYAGYQGVIASTVLSVNVPLSHPEAPGKSVAVFRGRIPIRSMSRRSDPLVVPLVNSAGKSFSKGDLQVTIHEIRTLPNNRQIQIELSAKNGVFDGPRVPGRDDGSPAIFRLEAHRQNIEILDAQKRAIPWFPGRVDADSGRMTLTLTLLPDRSPAQELRLYSILQTELTLPFAFKDVPMP